MEVKDSTTTSGDRRCGDRDDPETLLLGIWSLWSLAYRFDDSTTHKYLLRVVNTEKYIVRFRHGCQEKNPIA